MRQRLAGLEHARREFIANASHELRTPLFSLGGHLELLVEEDLDDATRREFLGRMREQVDRLTKLAGELLDLSRLDAGRLRVDRDPVDLAQVTELLLEEFDSCAQGTGHELSRDGVDGSATGLGDQQRILQVGRALVENALRHTPPGTHVLVSASRNGDRVALIVEDDGPGMLRDRGGPRLRALLPRRHGRPGVRAAASASRSRASSPSRCTARSSSPRSLVGPCSRSGFLPHPAPPLRRSSRLSR